MARGHGWRGYRAVDTRINTALVAAAARARPHFIYVSVLHAPAMRALAYVDTHERVVDAIVAAGLPHAILRPSLVCVEAVASGDAALELAVGGPTWCRAASSWRWPRRRSGVRRVFGGCRRGSPGPARPR